MQRVAFFPWLPVRLRSNRSPARRGGRALGVLERIRRHARPVEHLARDEDRERVPKRQCDPVGGTCVDTRSALAHLHEHAGDECFATDLVDLHADDLASQLANDRLHQVVGERPRVVLFRQTELDGERLRAADHDGQRLAPGGIDENHRGTASAQRQYPAHFHLDRVGRAGSQAEYPDENHQAASAHGKPPRTLINRARSWRRSRYAIWTAGRAQPLSYSSCRRHQTPVSLRPLVARSSHWYMPQAEGELVSVGTSARTVSSGIGRITASSTQPFPPYGCRRLLRACARRG